MAKERRGIKVNSQLTVSLALMRPYYLVIYPRAESSLSSSLRASLTTRGYLEVTEVFCALTCEEMERPAHSHPPRAHGRGQAGIRLRIRHEVRALDPRSARVVEAERRLGVGSMIGASSAGIVHGLLERRRCSRSRGGRTSKVPAAGPTLSVGQLPSH